MKETTFKEIVTPELAEGAILNEEYQGFKEDYLVLHSLIKKYKPKTFFEIGTNMGTGTNIICNANPGMGVFSLDLPYELAHVSLQSPVSEGKGMNTGKNCKFLFIQLWGDSMSYDYSQHFPIEGWYIDGEHVFDNVFIESLSAFSSRAKIIIWHDTDMPEVMRGILEAYRSSVRIRDSKEEFVIPEVEYELFRVIDTRISFALWRDLE